MKNQRTRHALLMSMMSILLCVAMLIGSTFAWFTDTASTAVNKIQAGKLDVQLVDAAGNSLEGTTLSFKKAADGAKQDILWEPGCTYELPDVYVKNNGNLALKYKIAITGIQGDAKLNEAIEWTISDTSLDTAHSLAAGATSAALTIKGHMKEAAGNEYQGLSIDGIGITVYAAQDTVEYDSYNNTYDEKAEYPIVATVAAAVTAKDGVTTGDDPVVIASAEKSTENPEQPVVKASIPAGVKLADNATEVTLSVKETAESEVPKTITVESNQAVRNLEISVTGIDNSSNTQQITVEVFIGKGLSNPKVYHDGTEMAASDYDYSAATGILTIRTAKFSPFTVVYDSVPTEIARIQSQYSADGMNMPAGVEIADTGSGFTVTLKDEEAFIYFTQVFDAEKAYEARYAAGKAGTITKYDSERNCTNYNMWCDTGNITVKMGCDVDLKGMTVSTVKFGRTYGPKFDGCGHTIKNAKMSASSGAIGFFNGTTISISNVTFDNFNVSATGCTQAAVVAGYVSGTSSITNVTVKNSSVTGGRFTGTIVGQLYTGDVTNCKVENTVVCGQYKVGGILGQINCDTTDNRNVTDNVLTNVTVSGNNIWEDGATFALGKIAGCWAAKNGFCRNNTFTGGTDTITENIGKTYEQYKVTQE